MRCNRQARFVGCAVIVTLLLVLPARGAVAQSGWDRYKPGTLAAAISESDTTIRSALLDKGPSDHFLGYDHPILAAVIYTGDSRPIDPKRREIIVRWGMSYMRDSSIAADFHREYLFQEGDMLLWLPVQDTVASFFSKELRPGGPVHLFVMLLGGHYESGKITWAFVVNEFKAGASPLSP